MSTDKKQHFLITKEFWDANPAIQATHKVGDTIEMDAEPGANTDSKNTLEVNLPGANEEESLAGIKLVAPKDEKSSSTLDELGKDYLKRFSSTTEDIILPSGAKATVKQFKARDMIKAQRFMVVNDKMTDSEAQEAMMPAIIAVCTLIDGKPLAVEDVQELDGWDYVELMGRFSPMGFRKS